MSGRLEFSVVYASINIKQLHKNHPSVYFEKAFKQIEVVILTRYIQRLQRLSLCIGHRHVLSHCDVPDLLFQLSLTTRFNVKGNGVHTNSVNNRMKENDSLISISNIHDAVLQRATKATEAAF